MVNGKNFKIGIKINLYLNKCVFELYNYILVFF